jgi:hypothetical protein
VVENGTNGEQRLFQGEQTLISATLLSRRAGDRLDESGLM